MQLHDGAAAVRGILVALDQSVLLELARQLAHRGQREPERSSDLGDRLLAFGADVREQRDVPTAEWGLAVDEREQLRGRASPGPQAPHHAPERFAELGQLLLFGYH